MRKGKKAKSLSSYNKMQTRVIIFIVLLVFGAVLFNQYRIHVKSLEYAAKEAQLDEQIAEAEAQKQELEEKETYMQTDAYKEEIAREEFGMIKEGEYVLKEQSE